MPQISFEELEYAKNRNPNRLYFSKRFKHEGKETNYRYGYQRFEVGALKELVRDGDEFVLHETATGIQQIKAKFKEDGRGLTHLHIQRWGTKTGNPIGEQIVLYDEQISKLLELVERIRSMEFSGPAKIDVGEADLCPANMQEDAARQLLLDRPDLVAEFARNQFTTEDVVALAYRREQLSVFSKMLDSAEETSERSWQDFFERNQWIFGYGLSYIFTTGLDGRALQQTIRGTNLIASGKIPDAIMKTRAEVSALCLVEIKKSSTELLHGRTYRAGTWAPSSELSGAVAQCQETLRAATETLDTNQRFFDDQGNPTGEELMSVQPRSFLVIGSLAEFQSERGVSTERYQAFEGFRRNLRQPEILTFDELYHRACFIVDGTKNKDVSAENKDGDEIPF